ncbi:prenyltransferase [Haloparvum sedimenti]|uniref:prenyltransferase n=1 Tax=Haloparvum sedimenti TaxID=1678448 RepID=UPI00071E776E|nr:prenyltransferase [Haloparvum sedimenti]
MDNTPEENVNADGGRSGSDRADSDRSPGDSLRYLLTLSRPRFWLYLAGPVAVGVVYAADSTADLLAPAAIGLFAYFLFPANVLLYGVNDAYDAEIDARNPKKANGDAAGVVADATEPGSGAPEPSEAAKEARWRGDPLAAVAVAASGLLGLATFALAPPLAWPYLAGFFLLGVEYSAPPLRFKTTPLLDSLSNGLYILPGAAAYATVAGAHPPALALAGAWLWTMAMHTFSAVPDIEPDRAAGITTTATALGKARTYAYCLVCWTGAAAAFAALDVRFLFAFGVYPLFLSWVATSDVAVERAYWWFPLVNGVVGAGITMGGLWLLVPVTEVVG